MEEGELEKYGIDMDFTTCKDDFCKDDHEDYKDGYLDMDYGLRKKPSRQKK